LKQYEMQLTATLGPGLARSSSPVVLPFVCSLATELLTSGITTSFRRIVGLVLPYELHEAASESDDEDDGGGLEGSTTPMNQVPELVNTECMLFRLQTLAKLTVFCNKQRKIGPSGIVELLNKAIMLVGSRNSLFSAWAKLCCDTTILLASMKQGHEVQRGILEYVEVEDAYLLLPAYIESFGWVSQAAAYLPKTESSQFDRHKLSLACTHLATAFCESGAPAACAQLLDTVTLLTQAIPKNDAPSKEFCTCLIRAAKTVLETAVGPRGHGGEYFIAAKSALGLLKSLLQTKATRRVICPLEKVHEQPAEEESLENKGENEGEETFNVSKTFESLVEAVLLPVARTIRPSHIDAIRQQEFLTSFDIIPLHCAEIQVVSLGLLGEVLRHSPGVCKAYFRSIFTLSSLAIVESSLQEGSVAAAVEAIGACLEDADEEALQSVFSFAKQSFTTAIECERDASASGLLQIIAIASCGLAPREIEGIEIFRSILGSNKCLVAIRSLRGILCLSDDKWVETASFLMGALAPDVSALLVPSESLGEEVCVAATRLLVASCALAPGGVQFVLLAALSLAEGLNGPRDATKEEARACLAELTANHPAEVRGVVQNLPAEVTAQLQSALRLHLQAH